MAHGTPDFGITAGARTTHQLDDLGEHAVRLGSIDAYDRRGDVYFFDDFEAIRPRYAVSAPDTGAGVGYNPDQAKSGIASLMLTAGSDGGRVTSVETYTPGVAPSRIGLEVSFLVVWRE